MTTRDPPPIAPGLYDPAEFVARAPRAVGAEAPDALDAGLPPPLRSTPWRRRFGWLCLALVHPYLIGRDAEAPPREGEDNVGEPVHYAASMSM